VDYGFAPTRDDYNALVRSMFSRRPTTTLVSFRSLVTLRGFIAHLVALPSGSKPIGDILLGGHANSSGEMFIKMWPLQRGRTTFEVLEQALEDPAHPLGLPDPLIGFTPGSAVTHAVRFKGCNIGKDRPDITRTPTNPFLDRFKQALGGNVIVTAPKHFHYLFPARSLGVFESMTYEFVVRIPAVKVRGGFRGFANKAELVQACSDAGFTDVNGTPVPATTWTAVIPRNIRRAWHRDPPVPLGVAFGRRQTAPARTQLRIDSRPFRVFIPLADMSPLPTTDAERFDALDAFVGSSVEFGAGNDYPKYERLGYADFRSLMDGWHWTYGRNRTHMICTGRRYAYTVSFPVTDAGGNLVFNFYPRTGSPHAPVLTGLQETDPDFFASV